MHSAKRYLVFAGWHYYPAGGAEDFKGSFDDVEEAKALARAADSDWAQVFDTHTETIIHQGQPD